jgi:hypothetical protein
MNVVTKHTSNRKVLKESKDNKENSLISGINKFFVGLANGFLGMKVHKGPLNLSSISMKDPIQLMKDIIIAIEELTINYKIVSFFFGLKKSRPQGSVRSVRRVI